MKSITKKFNKLINLTGDSIDLNTLKEREKKINDKYTKNISSLNNKLEELRRDEQEIIRLYEFRDRYLGLTQNSETTAHDHDSDSEEETTSSNQQQNQNQNRDTIRERIKLVFTETTHKLSIIENDISSKVSEITNKKEELEREYERAKETIQQKLREKREKIKDNKKSLF